MATTPSITDVATRQVQAIFDAMGNWQEVEATLDQYGRLWGLDVAPQRPLDAEAATKVP